MVKVIKVKKVVGDISRGVWYNGKFYSPLKSYTKKGTLEIVSGIQFGKRKFYTLDKTRRTSGFAPKNLL